uniref:Uncharacterized protein n=1 Tax=Picea sitchensis TaxID=3332 RepID=A9NY32_PICSI|nr:unknown [Picea sitchensis]
MILTGALFEQLALRWCAVLLRQKETGPTCFRPLFSKIRLSSAFLVFFHLYAVMNMFFLGIDEKAIAFKAVGVVDIICISGDMVFFVRRFSTIFFLKDACQVFDEMYVKKCLTKCLYGKCLMKYLHVRLRV